MIRKTVSLMAISLILITGCRSSNDAGQDEENEQNDSIASKGTFGYDLTFLTKWDDNLVILSADSGKSQIIISPKYQGKVFTSTAAGLSGKSFGWINYDTFDKPLDSHMNAYGGEDRLWLGPEGGPFSLFFEPGKKMTFENWRTPAPIDSENWELVSSSGSDAVLSKDMVLENYRGTHLKLNIHREIKVIEPSAIENILDVSLDNTIKSVGFETVNTLTNKGDFAWNKETGAPCMWNLDMFMPSPKTVIVVPYHTEVSGEIATTDYFGQIPADRVKMDNGVLFFKADGKSRGKLGMPPLRTKRVAGSYSADEGVLTIISFDVDTAGTYLNQEWTTEKNPFIGDAVNAYNDGPLEDGSQMGPFLELESVSPAAFVQPNEGITHVHRVFHFTGGKDGLNKVALKVLNASLEKIADAF